MAHATDSYLTRRDFFRLSGGIVAAGALSSAIASSGALGAPAAAAANSKIKQAGPLTFAYQTGYNYGMFYVAQHRGWFKKYGLSLTNMTIFSSGTNEVDALMAGDFDAAVLGFVPVLTLAAQGQPIRIIDVVDNSGATYGLLSQKTIHSVPDLKGRSVGVTLGTNYQYFLDQMLKKYGMGQSDVQIVNVQPTTAQSSFLAGQLDAIVPVTTNIQLILSQRPGAKVLFSASDFTKAPHPTKAPFAIYDLLVTNEKTLVEHRPALVDLIKVFHTMVPTFVQHHFNEAVNAIDSWQTSVVKAQVTPTQIGAGLKGDQFFDIRQLKKVVTGGELTSSLSSIVDFLITVGTLSSKPDLSKLIDKQLVHSLS